MTLSACKFRSFRQAISVQTGRRFRWKPTGRWGQEVNRVVTELRVREIGRVFTALQGNSDLSQHGFPAHGDLDWYQPATGWIVISLTQWAFGTNAPPFDGYAWLKAFDPVAIIG